MEETTRSEAVMIHATIVISDSAVNGGMRMISFDFDKLWTIEVV